MLDEATTKRCKVCGETKAKSAFSREKKNRDGLQGMCKACAAQRYAAWHSAHRDHKAAYWSRYYTANQERVLSSRAAYYQTHREQIVANGAKYWARWKAENPDLARLLKRTIARVQRAVKRGDLIRPEACEKCGKTCRVTAAHWDYSQPLAVRWLCRSCHAFWDIQDPKLRNSPYIPPQRPAGVRLTETQVRACRAEYGAGGITMAALARRYGVDPSTVSLLVNCRTWKHLRPPE